MNAKISYKDEHVHYMTKNYVVKPIYNYENECINDTLSRTLVYIEEFPLDIWTVHFA